MQVRAFLNRTYKLESRIRAKQERIEYWKNLAVSITAPIANYGRSSEVSRKLERCTIKIAELETEILDDIERLVDTEREISNAIAKVQNPLYKSILEQHYLAHKRFEEIAVREGYTYRWVQELHKRALRAFEESVLIPFFTR